MKNFIAKEKTYKIIEICMDVHNSLGAGFVEIVHKDALEYEFRKAGIPYETINYLKVSQNRVALLVNFGEIRLNYKRLIL